MVQSQAQQFNELGFVHVASIFSPDEVEQIRETFTRQVESGNGKDPEGFAHDDHVPEGDILHKYPRFVHPHRHPGTGPGKLALEHMMDERLLAVVEDLVGPAYGAQSMFYFKPPGARGQAFHQDNMSLQAAPEMCIAAWIAIDKADADNGALRVVPKSHKQELICTSPDSANPELSFSNNEIHIPDTVEIHQTVLEAGDVLFFHGALVHGSLPNKTSDRFRRALIFHYIPQGSREVAKFYLPLIDKNRQHVYIEEAPGGGACGEGWVEEP